MLLGMLVHLQSFIFRSLVLLYLSDMRAQGFIVGIKIPGMRCELTYLYKEHYTERKPYLSGSQSDCSKGRQSGSQRDCPERRLLVVGVFVVPVFLLFSKGAFKGTREKWGRFS